MCPGKGCIWSLHLSLFAQDLQVDARANPWRPLGFAGVRGYSKVRKQPQQVSKLFSLTIRASPRARQWTPCWALCPSNNFDFQTSRLCYSLHCLGIRVAIHCLLDLTWDFGDPLPSICLVDLPSSYFPSYYEQQGYGGRQPVCLQTRQEEQGEQNFTFSFMK